MKPPASRVMMTRRTCTALAALLCLAGASALQATTHKWIGGASTANMRNAANWDTATIPAPSDDLVFTHSLRLHVSNNNNLLQGMFNSITFDTSVGPLIIAGKEPLTISTSIVNNSASTQTIANPIVLSGSHAVDLVSGNDTPAGDLVVSGEISGSTGLTKKGAGSVLLTGDNSYTGPTIVAQGVLVLGKPCLPDAPAVQVAKGAVLQLDFEGTDQVGSFEVNGQRQPPGIYGAPQSGAAKETPALKGKGRLKVAS